MEWWRVGVLVLVLGLAALGAWRLGFFELRDPEKLRRASNEAQRVAWIGPIFVAAYTALAALALPISPLSIMGGVVFGFAKGCAFVWIASVLGGTGGYWLARGVAGQFLKQLLPKGNETVARLTSTKRAFWPVLRLQLLPVTPFGLVNATAATSGVSFQAFIAATALGVIPGTIVYVFLGDRLRAGIRGGSPHHAALWAGAAGIVLVLLSFAPKLVRK